MRAMLALGLAVGALGCELMVGPEPLTVADGDAGTVRDGPGDGNSSERGDAGGAPSNDPGAGEAAPAPDAGEPCVPTTCDDEATACAAPCTSAAATCNAQCGAGGDGSGPGGGPDCTKACSNTEHACKQACLSTCNTCVAAAVGCKQTNGCGPATN